MPSKLILILVLASIGTICIAGCVHSRVDSRIVMPSSEALRARGTMLSMNVEELTRLGIFDDFAEKEVLKSEIPTMVDNALDACWEQHMHTMLNHVSDVVFFSVTLTKQSKAYKAQRAGLRAAVIQILYEEIKSQQTEQAK